MPGGGPGDGFGHCSVLDAGLGRRGMAHEEGASLDFGRSHDLEIILDAEISDLDLAQAGDGQRGGLHAAVLASITFNRNRPWAKSNFLAIRASATRSGVGCPMTSDQYLRSALSRHQVDMGPTSPVLRARAELLPLLQQWGNQYLLSVNPSGSFAKGTAVRLGTDLDLFLSLRSDTPETLQEIHNTLFRQLEKAGYTPRRQTVSLGVRTRLIDGSVYDVDLVPAKLRIDTPGDFSLYHRRSGTTRKTNVARHIQVVLGSGRLDEIRLMKIWRTQKGLDFPSFYLELVTIEALRGHSSVSLAQNFLQGRIQAVVATRSLLTDEATGQAPLQAFSNQASFWAGSSGRPPLLRPPRRCVC
jgi:hypothetical protein